MGKHSEGKETFVQERDPLQLWREAAVERLADAGPVCRRAAEYVEGNDVRIDLVSQPTGARWRLSGGIELNPNHCSAMLAPLDPQALGFIVHEATHLEQGIALALSVQGEVEAWRKHFQARAELGIPILDPHWLVVAQTAAVPTDDDLRKARREMLEMTGYRYLIWLLPLRPNPLLRLLERLVEVMRRL